MKNRTILIVEDEFIVANDLSTFLKRQNFDVSGIASCVLEALHIIDQQAPDMVLLDIHLEGQLTGIDLAKKLQVKNIPFIYLSAYSNKSILEEAKATKAYGFLVKPFREKDLLIALEIAGYHVDHDTSFKAQVEKQLAEKISSLSQQVKLEELLKEVTQTLQLNIQHDFMFYHLVGGKLNTKVGYNRIGPNEYQCIGMEELSTISKLEIDALEKVFEGRDLQKIQGIYHDKQFEQLRELSKFENILAKYLHLQSAMFLTLNLAHRQKLHLSFYGKKNETFDRTKFEIVQKLETAFSTILPNRITPNKLDLGKTFPKEEKLASYNPSTSPFKNIIGKSPQLLNIFDKIQRVAPMKTAVLILGESGTGKELFAKCIHEHSSRSTEPFVVINCGAIPENLIESTLFGHVKGAFTGAVADRVGKFEQANRGTIFLDEIGDMPLEMQVRLLRVLQENEIERIGDTKTIPLDVRVIAATNKNLETEVETGKFRLDLYYRLHVFPINTPTLEQRKEDIPLLVEHFIKKFSNEKIKVSETVMELLMDYSWPGNIRELSNYIERSILLANNNVIKDTNIPFCNVKSEKPDKIDRNVLKPLADIEKEYILSVLRICKGKVYGIGGAAEILNLPSSTLNSKIKKLGINKSDIYLY